jgi:hypothetical protein
MTEKLSDRFKWKIERLNAAGNTTGKYYRTSSDETGSHVVPPLTGIERRISIGKTC